MAFTSKDHDLSLPDWGPYGKQYAGASHIADRTRGLRFDLSVFPGLYRRRVDVPNVRWESGWHPWDCAPDFSYFSYRHQIVGKDEVYADIAYSRLPDGAGLLVRCEFVNASAAPCQAALHYMASLHAPSPRPYGTEPLQVVSPRVPEGGLLRHSLDYETLDFADASGADGLIADGLLRGEIRGHGFLDGSALGGRFGRTAGDRVSHAFEVPAALAVATLVIRGRAVGEGPARFTVSGAVTAEIELPGGAFADVAVSLGALPSGRHDVVLTSAQTVPVEIVFLALLPGDAAPLIYEPSEWNPAPERLPAPDERSLILKYPVASQAYGLAWDADSFETRRILNSELDSFLREKAHDHVSEALRGDGGGHYTNVFVRPVILAPGERKVLSGVVCSGDPAAVESTLRAFVAGAFADVHARMAEKRFEFGASPSGETHLFSQQRMVATTLGNVVFPIYTQRQFIRHRPPGRWWDSLYTWDSGFIGLGLLEIDPGQAWENLAQYLTEPGNPHAAYIAHGSMVPVQIHLYHELWNRTRDETLLARHYDAVRQYYLYFAGHSPGSTTRNLRSGLLRSWDYFYNSGGWDDYPPQKHVHANRLTARAAPVVTTAQAVRAARSLALIARHLGRADDVALYERDAAEFSAALDAHAWDAETGFYGYVVHDADGRPDSLLRHESGANYNLGLDGLHPLASGVGDAERERAMLENLFDERRLWTNAGLTAVDLTAPYYRADGYWSGTVWMPHQWFFWKAMLDLGRPDLAFAIASRALELWRDEVNESHHCFEHFLIETRRGCGWHQFSGLSTPVLAFFAACHCPGHLTVGFDAWVEESVFSENNRAFDGRLRLSSRSHGPRAVLVRLEPATRYRVEWNGAPVSGVVMLLPGLLGISLPGDGEVGRLQVRSTT